MKPLAVKIEKPAPSELKKWLDVPADNLRATLTKYITDSGMLELALVEIESNAHVTFEKEPEKE